MDLAENLSEWSSNMYLEILKVSSLGKFCGQRTRWIKVLEKIKNFEKISDFEENTRNSYSKRCFRGAGVTAGSCHASRVITHDL